MLVLSRQRDETIMIGDDVMITVVDIRGDKVRLGITAPTKIAVHRKEVYEAIKAENERAAHLVSADADALKAAFRSPPNKGSRGALSPSGPSALQPPGSPPTTKPTIVGSLSAQPAATRTPMPLRRDGTG